MSITYILILKINILYNTKGGNIMKELNVLINNARLEKRIY